MPVPDITASPVFNEAYWDRPNRRDQGDITGEVIYTAVGFALSNWEMTEEALAELYLALVESPKSSNNPVRRTYGAIESNSGRRKVIEAAAEAYFGAEWDHEVVRRAFRKLIQTVGYASKRRDDIARGITLGQRLDGKNFGYFLFPPDYNTARTLPFADVDEGDPLRHTLTKYRFISEDIRAFGRKFHELQDAIRNHAGLIRRDDKGRILFARFAMGLSYLDP